MFKARDEYVTAPEEGQGPIFVEQEGENGVMLCSTRMSPEDVSDLKEPRDRETCMNLHYWSIPFGELTVCIACDKWNFSKAWSKGAEREGWKKANRVQVWSWRGMAFLATMASLYPWLDVYFWSDNLCK